MSRLKNPAPAGVDLTVGTPADRINWGALKTFRGAKPSLLWATVPAARQLEDSDHHALPEPDLIRCRYDENFNRKERGVMLASKVFWEEFRKSQLVILFDKHAERKLLNRLYDEFSTGKVKSVKSLIVFAGRDDKEHSLKLVGKLDDLLKAKDVLFHYVDGMKSNVTPYPHDRFAVTDGEFWHFGGSVGGVEPCLTATSRGWKALDLGVENFVRHAWESKPKWG